MMYMSTAVLYSIIILFLLASSTYTAIAFLYRTFIVDITSEAGHWLVHLSLLSGLINMVLIGAPAYLFLSRWFKQRKKLSELLPMRFRSARRFGYIAGLGSILFGHVVVFTTIALIVFYANASDGVGMPLGLGFGFALLMYGVGITSVEVSIRRWLRDDVAYE